MQATVIREFKGVPDGEVRTRTLRKGETITGDLARVAVDAGFAKAGKAKAAAENKAKAAAPQNKSAGDDAGN